MGYCVASGGNFLRVILWRVVVISYRPFDTNYRSHLQGAGFREIPITNYILHVRCFSTPVHLHSSES
jgi:hypothetical protein